MFKHIVLYKLKDGSNGSKQLLVDKFMSMKGNIDVLVDVFAGGDELMSERSFDVALVCTFKRREDLPLYLEHPFHQTVRKYVHSVIAKAHSVDFFMEE